MNSVISPDPAAVGPVVATGTPGATIGPFLGRTRIAYFSMEIATRPEIHTYSGGLGILAGDTARACADLGIPAVFVTLICRLGYLRQEITHSGDQIEHPDPWHPQTYATPLRAKVAVLLEGREIWVRPWLYLLSSPIGQTVPVLLLDTDLDENTEPDRHLTDELYGRDQVYRLKQEAVLGIGGLRILQALGFNIRSYHLNEGHAALLALDLLRRYPRPEDQVGPGELKYEIGRVRDMCIFTTHTPVEAGHDRFPYEMIEWVLRSYVDTDQLRLLAGRDSLNMTRLALHLSGFVNGVADRHARTTTKMFPGYKIRAITNGVHLPTWTHPAFAELFNRHYPAWAHEPEALAHADQLDDSLVWKAHTKAKMDLTDFVERSLGTRLDPNQPYLGFARRMTAYKRPDLLFSDIQRLKSIAAKYPFQLVMAGKAHPSDGAGKSLIRLIHQKLGELAPEVTAVFLPNYDMAVAKIMVPGVDVWLNTPEPPLEASGTSGMKAAANGVLNLSVLDGWWLEACVDGTTGWAIGTDGAAGAAQAGANDLYDKLEQQVLPLYSDDRARWIFMMKEGISKIACYFNTHRMMRRYAAEAYLR